MPRPKHKNDYNHGKNGWVMGNPRYGKSGKTRSDGIKPHHTRTNDKRAFLKEISED